jgi:hypothetical protein
MTPEGEVKAMVRKVLDAAGAVRTMPVTRGFGSSGAADFIACVRGKFVCIETKATGSRAAPLQAIYINRVAKAGGVGIVVSRDAVRVVTASRTHDAPTELVEDQTFVAVRELLTRALGKL